MWEFTALRNNLTNSTELETDGDATPWLPVNIARMRTTEHSIGYNTANVSGTLKVRMEISGQASPGTAIGSGANADSGDADAEYTTNKRDELRYDGPTNFVRLVKVSGTGRVNNITYNGA